MPSFPVVLIPDRIEQALSAKPPVPNFIEQNPLTLLLPPKLKKKPAKPKRINLPLVAIELVVSIPLSFLIAHGSSNITLVLIIYPIFLTIIMFGIACQTTTYATRMNNYAAVVKEIEDFNAEVEANYNHDFRKFEVLARMRQSQYEQMASSPERVEQFRREGVRTELKKTISYDGNDGDIKMDDSKQRFYEYLAKYFSDRKIYVGLTLLVPKSELFYSPDFAYIDSSCGLHIDIEIDEPYIHTTGDPTHYVDLWSDRHRNIFFLDRGWIVIRFSEEQFVRFPDRCCKTIAEVIYKITQERMVLDKLHPISELASIEQWTCAEAIEMARKDYRENYFSIQQYSNQLS